MRFKREIFLFVFIIFFFNDLFTANAYQHPLLVVSLDGLRADRFDEFIQSNPSSNFARVINNGLKADYMTPIYPTLTFPNHFTLVTGNFV